ncbi:COPB2, partial [Symbiodinium sp. KB8]
MTIRVFNYNTAERVKEIPEAHNDYIRHLEVHPSKPILLSTSDDMTIRQWDWSKGWKCTQTHEGHAHYVMQARFNPKDPNTFATASLDMSVKVWGLNAVTPHYSLDGANGHREGVNCLDYYHGGDKPYLISGADDATVKVWDYQTRSCVMTLEGHTGNVTGVAFHPTLPLIISGGEDGSVRLWHSATYKLQSSLNYSMKRVWTVAAAPDRSQVAIGFDEGAVVLRLGNDKPVASLDRTGKVLIAVNAVVTVATLRGVEAEDGEKVTLPSRELGSTEVQPASLAHNSNGRFALRNKAFGPALDFVWSALGTGDYATRESSSKVVIYRNFKEAVSFRPPFAAEAIFGGHLLGVAGSSAVSFYDWKTGALVRRIEEKPSAVHWSESGDLAALVMADTVYVLALNAEAVAAASAGQAAADDSGFAN